MTWGMNFSWLGLDGKRNEPSFGFQKFASHDFDVTLILLI